MTDSSTNSAVTDFATVNFFTNRAIQDDPYPYLNWVREQGPVWKDPKYGCYFITGHAEAREVYKDPANFPEHEAASGTWSSCNAVSGPFKRFSESVEGDDITDLIVRLRDELPFSDQLPSFDPPNHTAHRHLLMRLLTPNRLKENEDFMASYAEQLVGDLTSGSAAGASSVKEFVGTFAEPFTLTVIADLEGVPEEDHGLFREALSTMHEGIEHKPLEFLYERFAAYIQERRDEPRGDVLSGLAGATFPDGTTPEIKDAALIAANLFVGGQETTVRLLGFLLRVLGERPDLQKLVRDDRERIINFVEETLRLESPLRTQFRMARVSTTLGGIEIPAGASIMLIPGACNRDPRIFDNPNDFDIDRPNARNHLTFGQGIHTCVGGPLARAEARVALNQILDRTSNIAISEEHHGPSDARRYEYLPTFFLRGLQQLHLELTPA